MKWAHLPAPGGIYEQNPQFLQEIAYIFAERDAHQERERKKREQEMKRNSPRRVAGRR